MATCKPTILGPALLWALLAGSALALGARREVEVQLDGIPYRPVAAVAAHYHLEIALPRSDNEPVRLTNPQVRLHLYPHSRRAEFNGTLVWLNAPVLRSRGRFYLSRADQESVLEPLLRPTAALRGVPHRRVLLDPGHGGTDSGTVGTRGTREKDLVLDLAHRTAKFLEAARVEVEFTRTDDRALSLDQRTRMAADREADLLVSIHLNSAPSAATGIETFVLPAAGHATTVATARPARVTPFAGNQHDAASLVLAHAVQRSLLGQTRAVDRGIRRARFQLLRDAPCPAILVEAGFLSSPEEESRLNDPAYRDRVARGLALGILDYLTAVRRSRLDTAGSPSSPGDTP